jgi:hypothetical protein
MWWCTAQCQIKPLIQTMKEQRKVFSNKKWLIPSVFNHSRYCPSSGILITPYKSVLHFVPLPSGLHLPSYWLTHISTPPTCCSYIQVHLPASCTSFCRWKQQDPPKHWYPTTTLHRITTQKISNWIFTTVKTSNLASRVIAPLYATELSYQRPWSR